MHKDRKELQKLAFGTLRLVKEFHHAQSRRADLDRVAFEILMLIRLRKQIRLTDIASELEFNPSSVTRRIQSLKSQGHIAAVPDPKDLRSSLVQLTEAGEEMLLQYLERSAGGLENILHDWSNEEIGTLASLIIRLADSMSAARIASDSTKGVSSNDVRE